MDDLIQPLPREELGYWLALDHLSGTGLGPKTIIKLLERLGSARAIWEASQEELTYLRLNRDVMDKFICRRKEIDIAKLLDKLEATGVGAMAYADERYPSDLRHISDPPLLLYFLGDYRPDDLHSAVAVVGTRRPSSYGCRIAKETAYGLAAKGVTIISGMAAGIDSIAHWGAIEAKGRTIAVAACGPDHCYPSSNRKLYREILDGGHGAVISEYFPGTPPDSWRFPARNRIVSGMSRGVVMVEGGIDSGAMITARIAFEQSREVCAFPGRVDSPTSDGPNDLIINTKASLVRNVDDILDCLNWLPVKTTRSVATLVELYGREKEVYELLSNEPCHFDMLCHKTGMEAGEMSATLTMLELAGVAIRLPGDWYTRHLADRVYGKNEEPTRSS